MESDLYTLEIRWTFASVQISFTAEERFFAFSPRLLPIPRKISGILLFHFIADVHKCFCKSGVREKVLGNIVNF